MSLTQNPRAGALPRAAKTTAHTLLEKKRAGITLTALTAYDYPTARIVDEAGVDIILVGDSLGMAVLGYENTLPVTLEEMLHHARAVSRAAQSAFLIADMPYGTYHSNLDQAVDNAIRFTKETGMAAVKIEGGGATRVHLIERLTDAEVPVVGHLGLTPQSIHRMGGYRVQGKTAESMDLLFADAIALQSAGAVALVLEGMPRELAGRITRELQIPTIGIGAGPECDGQILVFHDVFNLTFSPTPKFIRRYGDASEFFRSGIREFCSDIRSGAFPSDEESYHLPAETVTSEPGKDAMASEPVLVKA